MSDKYMLISVRKRCINCKGDFITNGKYKVQI